MAQVMELKTRDNAPASVPPAEEEYRVGLGRPPKEHRWKSGQSGNPKGAKRKKRSLIPELKAEFERVFSQKLKVTQGDRQRLISRPRFFPIAGRASRRSERWSRISRQRLATSCGELQRAGCQLRAEVAADRLIAADEGLVECHKIVIALILRSATCLIRSTCFFFAQAIQPARSWRNAS